MEREALISEIINRLTHREKHTRRGQRKGDRHGFLLFYLADHGGHASPGELCQQMGVSTPRIAVILKALEQDGLIERTVVADDRRKILVTLTDAGRQQVAYKRGRRRKMVGDLIDALSPEDAAAIPRILDTLERLQREQPPMDDSQSR